MPKCLPCLVLSSIYQLDSATSYLFLYRPPISLNPFLLTAIRIKKYLVAISLQTAACCPNMVGPCVLLPSLNNISHNHLLFSCLQPIIYYFSVLAYWIATYLPDGC